jgi:hypothetical protein
VRLHIPIRRCLYIFLAALAALSTLGCGKGERHLTRLPAQLALREDAPSRYTVVCDYFYLDTQGNLGSKQRFRAVYTRGLPGGSVRWDSVTIANATGFDEAFPNGEAQEFMNGFTYADSNRAHMLEPEFFRDWPLASPSVPFLKNLVWDTHMIEGFAQDHFHELKLNEPLKLQSGSVPLAGAGTFSNKQIDLTWVGTSEWNGEPCALLRYRAFFNKLDMSIPIGRLLGRSHYWGEIWVSLTDKQVEHATLYEDVLLEFPSANESKDVKSVFRLGTFQKLPLTAS